MTVEENLIGAWISDVSVDVAKLHPSLLHIFIVCFSILELMSWGFMNILTLSAQTASHLCWGPF